MKDLYLDYLYHCATLMELRGVLEKTRREIEENRPGYAEKHGIRNEEFREKIAEVEIFLREIMEENKAISNNNSDQLRVLVQLTSENDKLKKENEELKKTLTENVI